MEGSLSRWGCNSRSGADEQLREAGAGQERGCQRLGHTVPADALFASDRKIRSNKWTSPRKDATHSPRANRAPATYSSPSLWASLTPGQAVLMQQTLAATC